jgi:hypothetical protein
MITGIFISVIVLYIGYLLRKITELQTQLNTQKEDMLKMYKVMQEHNKCILMLGDEVFGKVDVPYFGIIGQA